MFYCSVKLIDMYFNFQQNKFLKAFFSKSNVNDLSILILCVWIFSSHVIGLKSRGFKCQEKHHWSSYFLS